jgi:hypothetical protein
VGGDGTHVYAASVIALKLAAVDGPIPIGDAVGAAIVAGAAAYDLSQRKFITYTLKNATGKIYVGRTSGFGDPEKIMLNRFSSHHMRAYGYGNPKLDRVAIGFPVGYYAIRGREQDVVDGYGGVKSSKLGNSINPIFKYNPNKPLYMEASKLMFGQFEK